MAISHDHLSLNRLCGAMEKALFDEDQFILMDRAHTLYTSLEKHFAEEEAPTGFFRDIEVSKPRLVPLIDRLRTQHTELLEKLESVRTGIAEDRKEVRRLMNNFLAMLLPAPSILKVAFDLAKLAVSCLGKRILILANTYTRQWNSSGWPSQDVSTPRVILIL